MSFFGRTTLIFVLATPLLTFIAVLAAGAGHGTYLPAKTLFPYTMAATAFTGAITLPLVGVGLVQYPLYGLILDRARLANAFLHRSLVVVLVHFVFVAVAIMYSHPAFTP